MKQFQLFRLTNLPHISVFQLSVVLPCHVTGKRYSPQRGRSGRQSRCARWLERLWPQEVPRQTEELLCDCEDSREHSQALWEFLMFVSNTHRHKCWMDLVSADGRVCRFTSTLRIKDSWSRKNPLTEMQMTSEDHTVKQKTKRNERKIVLLQTYVS